ncbi:hypothetical protein EAF00_001217 [Botryotinia globosa]|nr:hypothetical protein EAF00_001217 [Botryotinia globosa]
MARQLRFLLSLVNPGSSDYGSGKSKCLGLHNSGSSQFLAHTLNTLKAVQEQTSAATPRDIYFRMFDTPGKPSVSGHYVIQTKDEKQLVLRRSRPSFDKVFGKGSLKDCSAFPAAILPDFGNLILGIFVEWTYDRGIRLMQSDDESSDEENSSREAILERIDLFMEMLFFPTDTLSVNSKMIFSNYSSTIGYKPLDINHVRRFHRRISQDSRIRVFLVDWVAFIIQEIDALGKLKGKNAALNGDLSLNNRETLVELLHLLGGGKIRPPHGKFPDPRDAPSCVYHHHGSGQKCRRRVLAGSFMPKDFKVKA